MPLPFAHKPPVPEPDDEPIPLKEPEPDDEPAPHPDPVATIFSDGETEFFSYQTRRIDAEVFHFRTT